jgi:hypothetical protein
LNAWKGSFSILVQAGRIDGLMAGMVAFAHDGQPQTGRSRGTTPRPARSKVRLEAGVQGLTAGGIDGLMAGMTA